MAISCEPADLEAAAKCFCFSHGQEMAIQTYLLAVAAGGTTDPDTLADLAKEFSGISKAKLLEIQTYLLCQIANA